MEWIDVNSEDFKKIYFSWENAFIQLGYLQGFFNTSDGC